MRRVLVRQATTVAIMATSKLRSSRKGLAIFLVIALTCMTLGPASATTAPELAGAGSAVGAAANVQAGPATGASSLSGNWDVYEHWLEYDGTAESVYVDATYSFALTGPHTYTVGNGQGWWTSNVAISGPSMNLWTCGNGGTYSQTNQKLCPTTSGYWLEPWKFKFPASGANTATGTFKSYGPGGPTLYPNSGTFVAKQLTHVLYPTPSIKVTISSPQSTVLVGATVDETVTVANGPVAMKSVDVGSPHGLLSSTDAVVVPPVAGLSGFSMPASGKRTFHFLVKGAKDGTAELTTTALGTSSYGTVHSSASATLQVGDISTYTVNLQASIPQGIIVDPSTAAHYNTTADNGPEGFPKDVPFSQAVRQVTLLAKEPEFPECLPPAEVAEDTEKHMESEWYSYYVGNTSLGKVSVPLQWDESTQQVTLADSLSVTQYNLTRVFKYRLGHQVVTEVSNPHNDREYKYTKVVYDDQVEECTETVPVKMLVAPVAGGDGLEVGTGTPDNAFTLVAAWEFPFAPLGAAVNPEPSWSESFLEKYGPSLDKIFGEGFYEKNKPYLSTTLWSLVFGFFLLLESGGLAALLKAPAALNKLLTLVRASELSAGTLSQLKAIAGISHEALEYAHTANTARELVEELFQILGFMDVENGGYPVMSAVVRGKFTTEYGHGAGAAVPYKTLLGVSVQTTKFPNFWVTVSRKTEPPAPGATSSPFNGVLPWPEHVGAEPVSTHNPFAANPAGLVNDSRSDGHSYYSGAADVQNVVADTSQLPAVTKSIRDDANLDSEFGAEQGEAPDPACDSDGEATDASTICWLIDDGSGPNDHRA